MSTQRKCPFCAEMVQAEAIHCRHCRKNISPGICLACEKKNRPVARFCGHCGDKGVIGRSGISAGPTPPPAGFTAIGDEADPGSGLPMQVRCEKDGSVMALIPAGEFRMGSREGEGESDEHPLHVVRVAAFYLDIHPVTVARYRDFCRQDKREMPWQPWRGEDKPVVNVTWDDAAAYCEWAGKRLPSEAEWEKACRAGSDGKYCFGDDERLLGEYAWYEANSGGQVQPVGGKTPNQYGLYDMHGNVWEWAQDWHHDSHNGAPSDGSAWESPAGSFRVLRGGSWFRDAGYARSAFRFIYDPGYRFVGLGFRPAR